MWTSTRRIWIIFKFWERRNENMAIYSHVTKTYRVYHKWCYNIWRVCLAGVRLAREDKILIGCIYRSPNIWRVCLAGVRLAREDTILIGCIYRSPNSSDTSNEKLRQLIGKVNEANAFHILMMGDFNYPHINWVDDSKICERATRT